MPSVTRKSRATRLERRSGISERFREVIERHLDQGVSYTEVSVERLCKDAGVARSTFYTHFDDKGALLRELASGTMSELGEIAAQWWEQEPEIDFESLRAVMLQLVHAYRKHDALLAAVADTAIYDAEVRAVYLGMVESFVDAIAAMIETGREAHDLPVTGPARETAALLTWMAIHGYYQMARGADEATLERIADAHAGILWSTIHSS